MNEPDAESRENLKYYHIQNFNLIAADIENRHNVAMMLKHGCMCTVCDNKKRYYLKQTFLKCR